VDFNSLFFGLLICISLAVFLYIGKFRATEKQRNREDKIDWTVNRFGFLRTILWIMVSILAIALLARMFI
tara:strand:- start:90 stop:299 length:210 start_codon:yes stop_codon:yes gene_type:complete